MQKDVCDQQINRYTLMIHPCHVNAIYVIRTESVKQQICRSSISFCSVLSRNEAIAILLVPDVLEFLLSHMFFFVQEVE